MLSLSRLCSIFLLFLLSSLLDNASSIALRRAPGTISMPLLRHSIGRTTDLDTGNWASRQASLLKGKYGLATGSSSIAARDSGVNDLVNHNQDSSYFGSLAVGNPPISYNVILDTGSADMWLASSTCRTGCANVPTFNAADSSSFKNLSTPFQIQYGSGAARGVLGSDTVQMAGFSVPDQVFGVVSAVTANLLKNPVSGLLGLAFQSIAASRALPFWQALAESNVWDQPVMSFYLTRFINASGASDQEPGGRFTMGFIDSSLHTGDIEFIDIPSGQESYWSLPMSTLTINGANIDLGTSVQAAIDTGTTLIGGPAAIIDQIFAAVPGAQPGTGDFEGYYLYPCTNTVQMTISFGGGKTWIINPEDFMLAQLTSRQCLGALFSVDMGSNGPQWIVGDTFLKNVYSVFRFSPPSVGFAELSGTALDLAVVGGDLPSATIGANPAIATARGSSTRISPHLICTIAVSLTTLFI